MPFRFHPRQNVYRRRPDSQFFIRLTQRRINTGFSRLDMTAGKADFPRLPDMQRTDLHKERRFIFVPDDGNQDGC